jgi:hypothetical protein
MFPYHPKKVGSLLYPPCLPGILDLEKETPASSYVLLRELVLHLQMGCAALNSMLAEPSSQC